MSTPSDDTRGRGADADGAVVGAVRRALGEEPAPTDRQLLLLAAAAAQRAGRHLGTGERAAFERFVLERGPSLAALARGLCSSSAAAESALQGALAAVLERWGPLAATDDPYACARRAVVGAAVARRGCRSGAPPPRRR